MKNILTALLILAFLGACSPPSAVTIEAVDQATAAPLTPLALNRRLARHVEASRNGRKRKRKGRENQQPWTWQTG